MFKKQKSIKSEENKDFKNQFCTNCGEKITHNSKFCDNCGQPVGQVVPKGSKVTIRPKWVRGILLLMILAFGVGLILIFGSDPLVTNPKTYEASRVVLNFMYYLCVVPALVLAVRRVLKNYHRVRGILWVLVIMGSAFSTQSFLNWSTHFSMHKRAGLIKDSLTDAIVAKQLGDEAINKGVPLNASIQKAKTSTVLLGKTKPVAPLFKYYDVSSTWSKSLSEAKNPDEWKKLSAQPEIFTVALSNKDAKEQLLKTVSNLAYIKQFGDAAIARGDRETMRYIAARLSAEKHWLDGMENLPTKTSLLNVRAYAAENKTLKRTVCVKGKSSKETICISDVQSFIIGPLIKSAYNYLAEAPNSPAGWTNAGNESTPAIRKVAEVSDLVDSVEPSVPGKVAVPVNDFWQKCKDLNGAASPDVVKNNLPTSEDGYTCSYSDEFGGKCWNFITLSGREYKGGEGGRCESDGLLYPTQIGEQQDPLDGTYQISYSGDSCEGSDFTAEQLRPEGTSFIVSDRQFNFNNDVVFIDENNLAEYHSTTSSDGIDFWADITAQFEETGKVNGTWSVWAARFGQLGPLNQKSARGNISTTCKGAFSGQK